MMNKFDIVRQSRKKFDSRGKSLNGEIMPKKLPSRLKDKKFADMVQIDPTIPKYKCPIIVSGPDDYYDEEIIAGELSSYIDFYWSNGYKNKDICIVTSGRPGAEIVAEKVAKDFGINIVRIIPEYKKLGRRIAGKVCQYQMCKYVFASIKNKKMGFMLIFWDGRSQRLRHFIDVGNEFKLNKRIINVKRASTYFS